MKRILSLCIVVGFGVACGGVVSSGSNGSDAGPRPSPTDPPPTTSPPINPIEAGPVPDPYDSGTSCDQSHERLQLVVTDKGVDDSCSAAAAGMGSHPVDTIGTVVSDFVASMDGRVDVDTCPPWADCAPHVVSFRFHKTPDLMINKGAYVHVTANLTRGSFSCTEAITIMNVRSWGSSTNPIDPNDRLLFAGADGGLGTDAPLSVSKVPTGCLTGPSCGPDVVDDYQLKFSMKGAPDAVVPMGLGKMRAIVVDGRTYYATNLRSYYDGTCDDYWNYAWTVALGPTPL